MSTFHSPYPKANPSVSSNAIHSHIVPINIHRCYIDDNSLDNGVVNIPLTSGASIAIRYAKTSKIRAPLSYVSTNLLDSSTNSLNEFSIEE